jgi:hypothetical protein
MTAVISQSNKLRQYMLRLLNGDGNISDFFLTAVFFALFLYGSIITDLFLSQQYYLELFHDGSNISEC